MTTGAELIPTKSSITWATPSEPDDRRTGGGNSSSTSVPASVTQRPRRSEGKFETGNFAVASTDGSTTWRECSTPSSGAGLRTWPLLQVGALPDAALSGPTPRALGNGKIQTP